MVVMELVELTVAGGGKGMSVTRSTLIGEEVKGQVRGMPFCVRLMVTAGVYLGDGCLLTGCRLTVFHNAPLLSLCPRVRLVFISLLAFLSLSHARALSLALAAACLPASLASACCVCWATTHITHLLAPVLARSDDSESEDQRESPQLHAQGAVRGSGGGFGLPALSKVGAVGVLAVGDIGGALRGAVVGGQANARKAPSPHQLRDRCFCFCLRVCERACGARARAFISLSLSFACVCVCVFQT